LILKNSSASHPIIIQAMCWSRTKIGTKLGRKRKTTNQLEEDRKHPERMSTFYSQIETGYLPPAEAEDKLQALEEYKWSTRRMNHQNKMIQNFNGLTPRTPAEKKRWQDYWDVQLPRVCAMMQASAEFCKIEHNLMRECEKTFGSYEVYYVGPMSYFWKPETRR